MVISKVKQQSVCVNYYVEINQEYWLEILEEQNYKDSAVRAAITSQFSKLVREGDELNKHEWIYKDIKAKDKLIYRVTYIEETEETINY